ncbi:MAG: hypothetical protein KDA25_09900, partial [Phycisphaerales bacterium]|nr:hypothetical protein [Phycisphaerales bacterium]
MSVHRGVRRQSLADAAWTVEAAGPSPDARATGGPWPALVPGCVHLDLIRAGVIEHPNHGRAELDALWIGETDWRYETTFALASAPEPGDLVEIVAHGLDTIARVTLNDVPIIDAANMHVVHRADVGPLLRPTDNRLTVRFVGPRRFVDACRDERGARPVNGDWGQFQYIRKAACNFGWDWGPQVPTVGIWRPFVLETWRGARLGFVQANVVRADARRASVDVVIGVRRAVDAPAAHVRVTLTAPDGRRFVGIATAEAITTIRLDVPAPERWWPRDLGAPTLHDLRVDLIVGDEIVDDATRRIGLRTATLDTTPDARGRRFTICVNDRPVFARGANWIPDSLFPTEMTPARYRERLEQARAAGMNMIRVWGGGFYEDDVFYDLCDELGLLVWQDFMFACATYPEEPPYPALVEAEVDAQVRRLASHPAIVLWCGGNENFVAYESWGWKDQLAPGQTWGRRYWLEWIPERVRALDPARPYWPDSPYSGTPSRHPNDPDHGDRHTWDARGTGYRAITPRFVSEFGHQAPPCLPTLVEALGAVPPDPDDAALVHRQRSWGGNASQYGDLGETFAAPWDFASWHFLAQLAQARAITIGVEWARANRP